MISGRGIPCPIQFAHACSKYFNHLIGYAELFLNKRDSPARNTIKAYA